MKKNDKPIVVEQNFSVSLQKVWKAITDVDEMRNWFFDNIPAFKPEVGFATEFNVQSEERIFLHLWKVIDVVPEKLIKYNWKYEVYPGDSNVSFELFDEDKGTRLKLTIDVLEDFPDDIPEFTRDSCNNGWNYFIKERLTEYLEKNS